MATTPNLSFEISISNSTTFLEYLGKIDANFNIVDGYVAGKLHGSGTLSNGSWSGSSAPYTYALTVTGLLATDKPIVDLDLSSVAYADVEGKQTDWYKVYRCVSSADTLTFYATEAPTVDLPITVEVIR